MASIEEELRRVEGARNPLQRWGLTGEGVAPVVASPQLIDLAAAVMQERMRRVNEMPMGTPANTERIRRGEVPARTRRFDPEYINNIRRETENATMGSTYGALIDKQPYLSDWPDLHPEGALDFGVGSQLPRVPPGRISEELRIGGRVPGRDLDQPSGAAPVRPQVSPRPPRSDIRVPEIDQNVLGVAGNQGRVKVGPSPLDWIKGAEAKIQRLYTNEVPAEIKQHIVSREGNRDDVYPDTSPNKYLTAGIGHRLTDDELKQYKEGDIIPQDQIQRWFLQDTQAAWKAAQQQARELGVPELVDVLMPVNFQLGTDWNKEHTRTWELLQNDDFEGAAKEAANSDWYEQTPTRVEDFQAALRKLKL